MRFIKSSVWVASAALALSGSLMVPTAFAQAAVQAAGQPVAAAAPADTVQTWAQSLWAAAKKGDGKAFEQLLSSLPAEAAGTPGALSASVRRLREHYAWRETERVRRSDEVRGEMKKALEDNKGVTSLSKALISAMELSELAMDKAAVLKDPEIVSLVSKAEAAATEAERDGKWLTASELMVRLQLLMEETPKAAEYKASAERVSHRLAMLRMYTPKRLWELQNERRMASDGKPLPPYNALGDDFREKLSGITENMVRESLVKSSESHVDLADYKRVILGGIEGVRTMLTTQDLRGAFPGLASDADRDAMLAALADEESSLKAKKDATAADLTRVLRRLATANNSSVKVPMTAVYHEFGNGGMGELDEFSAIVWPYEVARFNKMIAGSFAGVGVHIEFDELSNVKVVSPIEGSPAHKAGIKTDDVIAKVGGKSVYGLPIDSVVDLITGPRGTEVNVTVERSIKGAEGEQPTKKELEFTMSRDTIAVPSVKGWRRTGVKESDWDYFIDPDAKIAYIRVLQFTDDTDRSLKKAALEAKKAGARGLVLDLRFNPGGLLDKGIEVARAWVRRGNIVLTRGPDGVPEVAGQGNATSVFAELPTVVLINRGSASASEIVSGALQYYGNKGDVPVVVLGQRSYGKGSVQQVYDLPGRTARLKLTCQYYMLPDMRIIHRRPGATVWGVDPNLEVEMLPKQIGDAVTVRKNADILPEAGVIPVDPTDLLSKNLDLQLEAAMVVLEAQSYANAAKQANAAK